MDKSNDILVINTGGTIDAEPYLVMPRVVMVLKDSVIPETLDELGFKDQYRYYELLKKDSKKFTELDLTHLAETIKKADEDLVVMTHGTDYMPENARFLKEALKGSGKTLVITGAMAPIMNEKRGWGKSNGFDNLTLAMNEVKTQEPDVYIAFDGKVMDPTYVWKDFENKRFEVSNNPVTSNVQRLG